MRRTNASKAGIQLPEPQRPNEVWHLDFGRISDGERRVWVLCVVDLFTRKCLTAKVQLVFSSGDIVQVLHDLAFQRGAPKYLIADRGQLFSDAAIARWAVDHDTQIIYRDPTKPSAKGVIEKFFRTLDLNGARNVAFTVNAWNRALKDGK